MKQQTKPNVVKRVPFGGKQAPPFAKKGKVVAKAKPKAVVKAKAAPAKKTAQRPKAKVALTNSSVRVVVKPQAKKKAVAKFNASKYEAARKKVFSLPNTKEY